MGFSGEPRLMIGPQTVAGTGASLLGPTRWNGLYRVTFLGALQTHASLLLAGRARQEPLPCSLSDHPSDIFARESTTPPCWAALRCRGAPSLESHVRCYLPRRRRWTTFAICFSAVARQPCCSWGQLARNHPLALGARSDGRGRQGRRRWFRAWSQHAFSSNEIDHLLHRCVFFEARK